MIIIAGTFQQDAQAERAVADLRQAGFADGTIAKFFVNPPGQHAMFPIGGDEPVSPGAESATSGAVSGAAVGTAVGAAVGAVATPVLGPVGIAAGAAVGAYGGSLYGALDKSEDKELEGSKSSAAASPQPAALVRKSGIVVAVTAPTVARERAAIQVLRARGAELVERAEGKIADSNWMDFNPLTRPTPVEN